MSIGLGFFKIGVIAVLIFGVIAMGDLVARAGKDCLDHGLSLLRLQTRVIELQLRLARVSEALAERTVRNLERSGRALGGREGERSDERAEERGEKRRPPAAAQPGAGAAADRASGS